MKHTYRKKELRVPFLSPYPKDTDEYHCHATRADGTMKNRRTEESKAGGSRLGLAGTPACGGRRESETLIQKHTGPRGVCVS